MAEKKQLVLLVEGNAALGRYWRTILSDYIEKVIRSFCGNEAMEAASPKVELALVSFNAHGPYSSCLVQQSGWTSNVDYFLELLSAMHCSGGGFCDAAIAEGLSQVLMMLPFPNGRQNQQNVGLQRHCILVSASNPHPIPTAVYLPPDKQICLSDAETVAKSFPQSGISLSVICPRQLLKLKAIYNAGKTNPSAADPDIDSDKNPHYLVLISENFKEACAALRPMAESATLAGTAQVAPPQSVGVNNMETNVGLSQQTSSAPQQTSSAPQTMNPKYIQIWEGGLFGRREGVDVFIVRLEGYRGLSDPPSLAEDWPSAMNIEKLVSQHHPNIAKEAQTAHCLIFRSLNQHRFLAQMQEKSLSAVIKLPTQTLVLTVVKDKACRLLGMLIANSQPVFQPQISRQQQQTVGSRTNPIQISSSDPKA